jgi:signal transduction histidine kinase
MRSRAAGVVLAVIAVAAAAGALDSRPPSLPFVLTSLCTGLMFGLTGILLTALRPGNVLGPLLAVAGIALTLEYALRGYANRGLPGSSWAAWAGFAIDPLFFPVPIALLLVLFPDGRLPSRRWRPFAGLGIALIVLGVVLSALRRGPLKDESWNSTIEWRGVADTAGLLDVVTSTGLLLLLGAVVNLLVRVARSAGEQRQRLIPLTLAGSLAVVFLVVQELPGLHDVGVAGFVVAVAIGYPVALAVGALRYRVWDLDRVLVAAIGYGSLTILITAVYVGVVVALGRLAGARGPTPALLPSIVATALVAVLFAPVQQRIGRLARRLVLGVRASPYEALAALPHQLADAPVADEVLPRTARALTEGLGVPAARVRAYAEPPAVAWSPGPPEGAEPELVVVPVRHLGVAVGDVAVCPSADRPLSTGDRRLLADLAAQAGPALQGVILAGRLAARLAELTEQSARLRASRQRIVTAEARGRRRIERDIHDGVQQHMVALAVSLDAGAPADARGHLDQCLQDLRDLARGIYPPVLASRGLIPALKARARAAPGDVRVTAAESVAGRRFPENAELAAYFACLEALQNAAKHAPGVPVTVDVTVDGEWLCFTVADRGPGFEPRDVADGTGLIGIEDRLGAVGGSVLIDSAPGAGTTVHGRLPVASAGPAHLPAGKAGG